MTTVGAEAPDVLVIFGITGDLARQMTFGALYRLEAADHGMPRSSGWQVTPGHTIN